MAEGGVLSLVTTEDVAPPMFFDVELVLLEVGTSDVATSEVFCVTEALSLVVRGVEGALGTSEVSLEE